MIHVHLHVQWKLTLSLTSPKCRVVKQLEVELGPDTGDLGLRVGLHSGQTTAGVLRGDRARFQLFGDTVNGEFAFGSRFYDNWCPNLKSNTAPS